MTSNAIRGIRRKKSSLCEVKVAVIGAPGVGKSGGYNALSLNCGYLIHILLNAIEGTKFKLKFVSTTGYYNKSDTLNMSHIFAYYAHSSNLKFPMNA